MQIDEIKVEMMTNKIVEFCNTFKMWPKQYPKAQTSQEKLSHKLALWLRNNHYDSAKYPFRYADVFMPDGTRVSTVLADLAQKYKTPTRRSNAYIINIVKSLSNYCHIYNEWPKHYYNPTNVKEEESNRLSKWLRESGYYEYYHYGLPFKYAKIMDDNVLLTDRLNNLMANYYEPQKNTTSYVLARTRDLVKYCRTYKKWPNYYREVQTIQQKEANFLYNWLEKSHYNHPTKPFKYADVTDTSGHSIKPILDTYYAIYGKKTKNIVYPDLTTLNIWQAQKSSDPSLKLYYYILELSNYMYQDFSLYEYYQSLILDTIKTYKLDLNFKDIIADLMLSINEQAEVYYDKYLKSELASNPILTKLYSYLYNYTLAINTEITIERQK